MIKIVSIVLVLVSLFLTGCAQKEPAVMETEDLFGVTYVAPPPVILERAPIVIETDPGPGPYVGETWGFGAGMVTVTLEVADRRLTSVDITGPEETLGIGSMAIDSMGRVMLRSNSIKVDKVSGATITYEAVLYAAEIALGKAGLTDADLIR